MTQTLNGNGPAPYEATAPAAPALVPEQRTVQIPSPAPAAKQAVAAPPARREPVNVRWDAPGAMAANMRPAHPVAKGTGYLPYRYRIAGLFTVGSQIPLPEIEFFREPSLGKDLDIATRSTSAGSARTPRSTSETASRSH